MVDYMTEVTSGKSCKYGKCGSFEHLAFLVIYVCVSIHVYAVNTSRASQTLKANNKALAQSLQYVKQELRQALNEIDRLRVEKQDLNMKLLRAENQLNLGQDHNSYQVGVNKRRLVLVMKNLKIHRSLVFI